MEDKGNALVCLFRCTYAGIKIINIQIETKHTTHSTHNTGRKSGREEQVEKPGVYLI